MNDDAIRSEVREYYTRAAQRGSDGLGHDGVWGASRYDTDTLAEAPAGAAELSMGCGNPLAMIDLTPGEIVLDLGSGGGLDVILSAKRVGPTGIAYGVDELDEMIEVARAHAAAAGVTNATFLKGLIENVPLPDASVDVVISNCVICLAPDKTPVFTEIARVLSIWRPNGRDRHRGRQRLHATRGRWSLGRMRHRSAPARPAHCDGHIVWPRGRLDRIHPRHRPGPSRRHHSRPATLTPAGWPSAPRPPGAVLARPSANRTRTGGWLRPVLRAPRHVA